MVSGIPRNGAPDPQHGCVRTPISCGNSSVLSVSGGVEQCSDQYSCVRDVCLQQCGQDTDCALGERCIAETSSSSRGQVTITLISSLYLTSSHPRFWTPESVSRSVSTMLTVWQENTAKRMCVDQAAGRTITDHHLNLSLMYQV